MLAHLHFATDGKERDALGICDSALSRHPRCAELLLLRARAHLLMGDRVLARRDLELCQRLGGLGQAASEEFVQMCKEIGLDISSAAAAASGVTSRPAPAHPIPDVPVCPATNVAQGAISPAGQASQVSRQHGKDAAAKVKSALQSEKQGLFRQAFQDCREALEFEPGLPD